jgi:capsular polysaccharide biosynthesis protein
MSKQSIRNLAVMHLPAWTHPTLRQLEMMTLAGLGNVLRRFPLKEGPTSPPRRAVATLQAYAAEQPDIASYIEIYPPSTDRRKPAHALGSHPVMRDGAWQPSGPLHPAFAAELSRDLPSAGVGIIRNGRVITSMGAVLTPDHCLISDVSHTGAGDNPYAHPLFSRLKLPEVKRIEGRVAVLTVYPGNLAGRPYYGHWVLDILPRLHLLEKSGNRYDAIVAPQVARYQRESLNLLGTGPVISEQGLQLQADELIVPSLAGFPIGNYSEWAIRWIRDRFLPLAPPATPAQPRRLFISRAKAATRRLLNEDELLSELAPLGFERVFMEDYSFIDGVRLLRDADAVVSPHGSNIVNIVFCRPGTPVIEIFSPKYVAACHYSAACQAELDYGYVLGRGSTSKHNRISENIIVNPAEVVELLRAMGVQRENRSIPRDDGRIMGVQPRAEGTLASARSS